MISGVIFFSQGTVFLYPSVETISWSNATIRYALSKVFFSGNEEKCSLILRQISPNPSVDLYPISSSIETSKIFARPGRSWISGQHCADSHFETAWFVTPRVFASSSCVRPFCFPRKAIYSLILIAVIYKYLVIFIFVATIIFYRWASKKAMTNLFDEFIFYPTSGWNLCCENAARITQAAPFSLQFHRNPKLIVGQLFWCLSVRFCTSFESCFKGGNVSGKIMCFIVRLKRIPRLFVVRHDESSVESIFF